MLRALAFVVIALLAAPALASGPEDNAPPGFRFAGPDGAFTYEAVVKLDALPAESKTVAFSILSMDGEGDNRVFNFRIEKSGFLAFIPLGEMGATGGALATIPTSGPHAINTRDWFHVAVSYDGNAATHNNLKLYWTRLGPGLAEANLIGQGTLGEDLGRTVADFAVGNEARALPGNGEAEPFAGCIDEVRISSVARSASDFFFVPAARRRPGEQGAGAAPPAGENASLDLALVGMLVDEAPVRLPDSGRPLSLASGTHRLDFDFGVAPGTVRDPVRLRCRLKGVDEKWDDSGRGMALVCEVLDSSGTVVSMAQFPALGASRGWQTSLEDSVMTSRSEPIHVPAAGRSVRMTLTSGAPDTTGIFAIDDLELVDPGRPANLAPLWANPRFEAGDDLGAPGGTPSRWKRGGGDPAIARITVTPANPCLVLADADQHASGLWTSTQALPADLRGDSTLILGWNESFHVIGGSMQRASYLNVPPGEYTFEAIATTTNGRPASAFLALPVRIPHPFWSRPWFWALAAAGVVGSLSAAVLGVIRHRSHRRLERLRLQNALASDRARIARDMHDDLGTRVTLLTMNASLVQRDLTASPEEARRHLGHLNASARDLITAMDDLVWAVDPANDTLDHLGSHLAHLAQEIFHDSPVRCTIEIPLVLPARTLRSDFRHHLSLAVKEALHNVLRHAGPCEATLSLVLAGDELLVTIADRGRGFDLDSPEAGNGLVNLRHRLTDLGGSCTVESKPGRGTTVRLRCPLPPASDPTPKQP